MVPNDVTRIYFKVGSELLHLFEVGLDSGFFYGQYLCHPNIPNLHLAVKFVHFLGSSGYIRFF